MEAADFFITLVAIYQTVLGKLLQIGDSLPSSSALKMEAADPFEAVVMISQIYGVISQKAVNFTVIAVRA